MAKTKAEKAIARKQGWQQAGEAIKKGLSNKATAISSTIEAAVKGAKAADAITGGHATGKTKALMAAAAAGKNVLKNEANNFKNGWDFIKGVFKGIFNHPDWYKYHGILSIPAHNSNSPYDPNSIKPIGRVTGTKYGPGAGVTHVVQVNVAYNDPATTEAFQLATVEAFKSIRLDLRSNLPYTLAEYRNYVRWTMALVAKAKSIERVLGWYNKTRGDIPELQDAISSVTQNPNEKGLVDATPIAMLNNIGESLADYKKLQAIISQLAIPKKLMEYLSWWFGSTFIDQGAPNPQLYINMLRQCPIFSSTNLNTLDYIGNWDIGSASVKSVITEALECLNVSSLMNSDIIKTGKYGFVTIADVTNYSPVLLTDYEYFSILINAYNMSRDNADMQKIFNRDYVRVDVMDQLNESNLVGIVHALSTWANYPTPVTIMSQAAYFTSRGLSYARNISGEYTSGSFGIAAEVIPENAFIQITGDIPGVTTINRVTANTQSTVTFSRNVRVNLPSTVSVAGGTFAMNSFVELSPDIPNNKLYAVISEDDTGRNRIEVSTPIATGSQTYTLAFYVNDIAISTYTGTANVTGIGVNSAMAQINGVISIGSMTYAEANALFGDSARYSPLMLGYFEGTLLITNTSLSYNIRQGYALAYQIFCEQVDYHVPYISVEDIVIQENSTNVISQATGMTLCKECYVPITFNYADIESVLYWMYLGLFSVE